MDGVSFDHARGGKPSGSWENRAAGNRPRAAPILQLYRPTSGAVYLDGVDLVKLNRKELRATRRKMQMIFQDPYASLNPRMTVGEIVERSAPGVHGSARLGQQIDEEVRYLLALVKLDPSYTNRYPHEFSGGQRQRIGVARALALRPQLVVCDEPISALDVSIQAQVVNLLVELQKQLNLTYLFIAHDLSMVRHVCDRVAVMYLGIIVELATEPRALHQPAAPVHPGAALLGSDPRPRGGGKTAAHHSHGRDPITQSTRPSGCRFRTRCPIAQPALRGSPHPSGASCARAISSPATWPERTRPRCEWPRLAPIRPTFPT